jgi:hypothetical protein
MFGPVNHGQTWKGWERSGEKGLIISDNQAQTWLIITINDTSIGDLPLIITLSDTCKNQPKTLDFDNTINLSSLIVSLAVKRVKAKCYTKKNRPRVHGAEQEQIQGVLYTPFRTSSK